MASSLVFKVERKVPELIVPAKKTPYEVKLLSDIDDQKCLQTQISMIQFYRNFVGMQGRDPVGIIKEAIAETLVYYYPFAGRLKEGDNGKLMVECNGDGVLFIEANASVKLDHFDVLQPPFQGDVEDLLYDVPGSDGILHCPLMLIQVTRFICGGFTLVGRENHTMADGLGHVQFMTAVGEIARGLRPTVQPVWKRELLATRNPPQISCVHHMYLEIHGAKTILPNNVQSSKRSFFFGPQEFASLSSQLSANLGMCSKFVLSACLWKCRTSVFRLEFDEEVRVALCVVSRSKFNPPLVGYYGNAVALPIALSSAGKLCQNPLGYALDLIQKAKATVTKEFMRSTADLNAKRGRPLFTTTNTYVVSDLRRTGFMDIDYGWGKPVYSGAIWGAPLTSFFLTSKNNRGEDGILVTIELPPDTMAMFAIEIRKMISITTHP